MNKKKKKRNFERFMIEIFIAVATLTNFAEQGNFISLKIDIKKEVNIVNRI